MEPFVEEGRLLPRSFETISECIDDFVVIEGNSGPDVTIQGMNYPLAKNPKVLNFLKHHNIR